LNLFFADHQKIYDYRIDHNLLFRVDITIDYIFDFVSAYSASF